MALYSLDKFWFLKRKFCDDIASTPCGNSSDMRFLFIYLFPCLFSVCFAQESEPIQYEAFRKLLERDSVSPNKIKQFFHALDESDESGDVSGLRGCLVDEHEAISLVSGIVLALVEPGKTRGNIHRLINKSQAPSDALFMIGSLVASKKTIDLFLSKWVAGGYQNDSAIPRALTSATGQNFNNLKDWADWWATNRETYRRKKLRSYDDAFGHFRDRVDSDLFDALNNINETIVTKENPASNAFAALGNMLELGNEDEGLSTQRGDLMFSTGQYKRASERYENAIERNPEDYKSRFFLGCIDFELQRYNSAKEHFDAVATQENAYSAQFLSNLTGKRVTNPEEPLLTSALHALKQMPDNENGGLSGLEDLVMSRVTGQAMAGRGIYSLSTAALHQIIADYSDNEMIQAGAVLLIPSREREPLLETLAERFPESPMIQYIAICGLMRDITQRDLVLLCAERWLNVEPNNLLPFYFREYAKHLAVESDMEESVTFPEGVWGELIIAANDFKPDPHHSQMIEAQKQVLALLENPFLCTVDQPNAALPLFKLAGVTKNRIARQVKKDRKKAAETLSVIESLTQSPGSSVSMTMNRVCISIARKPLMSAEELAEEKKQKEITSDLSLRMIAISNLPIPRLQKVLLEEYCKNPIYYCEGMGFF